VPQHSLQPHVLQQAGSLYLAGIVIVQCAVRRVAHGDRAVYPLPRVQDGVSPHGHRLEASLCNQQVRHAGGISPQHDSNNRRCYQRSSHYPWAPLSPLRSAQILRQREQTGKNRDENEGLLGKPRSEPGD